MTIYVDQLKPRPQQAKTPQARRHFGDGKLSAHMACDGEVGELHAFAEKLGLKRIWFQNHPRLAHYDLTQGKWYQATRLGAVSEIDGVPIDTRTLLKRCGRKAKSKKQEAEKAL